MFVVAVTGKARAGKDTIANWLTWTFGFSRDSLAAPIKRLVQDIFVLTKPQVYDGVLRELPLDHWKKSDGSQWTVRALLQFIGTELFRERLDPEIWVKSLCLRIWSDKSGNNYVVPDLRFPNELELMRKVFKEKLIVVKVVRPGRDGQTTGGIQGHISEAYDLPADHTFQNTGSIRDLNLMVSEFAANKLGLKPCYLDRMPPENVDPVTQLVPQCRTKNSEDCPNCADGHLRVRTNRGTGIDFLGCSNYPDCDYTEEIVG